MLTMNLQQLLSPWALSTPLPNVSISGLKLDHRQIQTGDLFIALQGHHLDARQYISQAIQSGAVAVLADLADLETELTLEHHMGVPVIGFSHLKSALSAIAHRFYQAPSQDLSVIGVTGTNGKTTVSQLLAQWLEQCDQRAAVMGTTGNGFLSDLKTSHNTTESALAIQSAFFDYRQQGASHVVMEVSSHGLVQNRVRAIEFNAAVFTNLSRDHLDYHGTMQDYADAKLSLFQDYDANICVINADDETGRTWLNQFPHAIGVSMDAHQLCDYQGPKLWLESVQYSTQGFVASFDSSWGAGKLRCALVGEFNVSNVLLSLATLLGLGFDKDTLLAKAADLRPVIGRMEVFTQPQKPMVVVDYAHTPDALEKALLALKRHCTGQLWCVFGCGGDRDVGKRPLMARIAESIADQVILTDDNPRTESPREIMAQMQAGMKHPADAKVIHDRAQACSFAFAHAAKTDVILIAGKGHEDYQITASGTSVYSDRETVSALMKEKS